MTLEDSPHMNSHRCCLLAMIFGIPLVKHSPFSSPHLHMLHDWYILGTYATNVWAIFLGSREKIYENMWSFMFFPSPTSYGDNLNHTSKTVRPTNATGGYPLNCGTNVIREVGAKAPRGQNHGAFLGEVLALLLVGHATNSSGLGQELLDLGLVDDSRQVTAL